MNAAKGIGVLILLVLISVSGAFVAYGTSDTITVVVKDKERVCSGGDRTDCKYLIYTDKETFENTDSFWYFKYNSSDVYGAINENETYTFDVYGFRFGFFSMYRNIVAVHKE